MAETTARRRGELIRAVFGVLMDHPDGMAAREVLRQVEGRIKLTEFEQSDFEKHPGVRRFEWHVRFASIKAVRQAGW